ncbi:hypothetical protein PG997_013831 [Apiospora hydei]|uniref:Peptidase S26 domain-containing protein n=1 Tax=Apiospora hydei TaxID=1337664 RepID=A0ABR1VAM6_9PEZI
MARVGNYFLGHPWRILVHSFQTCALAHYVFNHQYSFGWGYGPSMLPTFLVDGDIIIFDKHHRRGRDVRVGDCVSYHIPVSPEEDGVKRVIGMPGDYVLMNSPGATSDRMIQVPKGHCYIVGDNMPWSRDSRDYGPLPLALIKGKAIAKGQLVGWKPWRWFEPVPNGLAIEESS